MKNNIITLILVISFVSCKAQLTTVNLNTYNPNDDKSGKYYKDIDSNFDPFLGVWENTNGIVTFRVELYKQFLEFSNAPSDYAKDTILGKYYLIENADSSNENIICVGENMVREAYIIIANSFDGVHLKGAIYDTCVPEEFNSTFGKLEVTIIDQNTAEWKITRKGMGLSGDDYVIPTDIILTKQ